ncbi:hypothetical protein Tco_0577783 [Tanacetum coccineum]
MTMDIFTKGALWDYWKLGSDKTELTNEKTSNLEETNHDDEQEISEIFRIETNLFNYETPLCKKFKEFNYLLKIDPDLERRWILQWRKLSWACIVGNSLHYQDFEWYEALKDSELKEEALRNKAIMEGLFNEDVESNNEGWKSWDDFEITNGDRYEREYEEDEERCELFDDTTQELSVCTIRICEMIKYSFG